MNGREMDEDSSGERREINPMNIVHLDGNGLFVTLCTVLFKENGGDGDMVQKLRILAVLTEGLGSASR